MDILEGLNQEQLEAVTTTEGYVRVIAGAGSGKTRALTHRFAYLVNEIGISTSNILCVTFTNKAANEMKKRIRTMIGDYDTGYVNTFHGFCVQVLREDIHTMNYPESFMVLDSDDQETILKTVYRDANIDSRSYTFTMAGDMIGSRKLMKFEHIPYLLEMNLSLVREKYEHAETVADRIFFGYLYEQRKNFGLDFNDLMTFVHYIFTNFKEKREKWQQRLEYVMVDEFQDVSPLQYKLAEILSGYHHNLFIVGDPDQTIYSWRGARVEYILDFDKKFPEAKTIIMDKNYRSTPNILNASNSLIQKNQQRIEKNLIAMKKTDIPVIYNHARTVKGEAAGIASQIKKIVDCGKKYSDITILYRSHFVSRSIEEAFVKEKIPYILYSGVEFYKRKEVKDMLCYLRMIAYADDLSFLRVINEPRRNIGEKRIACLKAYAEKESVSLYEALIQNLSDPLFTKTKAQEFVQCIEKFKSCYSEMKISDLLAALLDESGYEAMLRQSGEDERLDNLAELKQSVFEYESTSGEDNYLNDYLEKIALYTNMDKEQRKESVKMMTIHTAKGLEFPYVFVCGLNEGIFPSKHVDTKEKLEEERRLAYVAYTRAEQALFLSDAEGINFDGSFRYPSRFIFNTDKTYLEYTVELEEQLVDRASMYIKNNEAKITGVATGLKVGDHIRHKVFGIGEIVEVKREQNCYAIKFEKLETIRSISTTVPLERLP